MCEYFFNLRFFSARLCLEGRRSCFLFCSVLFLDFPAPESFPLDLNAPTEDRKVPWEKPGVSVPTVTAERSGDTGSTGAFPAKEARIVTCDKDIIIT